MPLPADIEVALSLLQILGLLIPIAFVVLQPLLAGDGDSGTTTKVGESETITAMGSRRIVMVKEASPLVYASLLIISFFGIAAIAVSARLVQFVWGSWLITGGVVLLMLGMVGLVGLVWLIREEVRSEVPGV